MKVTKSEYDAIMLSNNEGTVGYRVFMEMAAGAGNGGQVLQHFIVDDGDHIKEIGRLNGYMINLLTAHNLVVEDDADKFRIQWRKLVKT